jgi:23S rRNA pseudouridine2605 synthase
MNNKEGNNKKKAVLDQRVLDLAQISQNLRCKKKRQGPKSKINTKVAEVVSDKVEKNRIRHLRDLKLKTKFV